MENAETETKNQPVTGQSDLTEKPLGRLMLRYALPCTVSLLVGALYNIVDLLFVVNADYLGSYGSAANTVVFPLTVIALGIAVMIGDGCCAFVSISLGAGRTADAHRSVGNALLLSVGSSAVLTAVYLLFDDSLLRLFGGAVNPETYAFAKEYFFWIALGIPLYMFGQAMNPVIRSDGSPRFAMAATLAGAVTNLILDPVFIYPLHMGMAGAAIATVIGQGVTAGLTVWYFFRMKTIRLNRGSFRLSLRLCGQFLSLGVTSLLAQASLVLSMAAVQNVCNIYGARDPVFGQAAYAHIPLAVLGIVMKYYQIAISVAVGLAAGCIPLAGYNMGARRYDRVRRLFACLLIGEAAVGLLALLVAEILPGGLVRLFGAAGESAYYTDFAIRSFRVYLCMMVLSTVNKGTFIYLQALGKPVQSTIVSLCREVVFGVSLPLLLPVFFGLDGVLYSFPAADLLTFLIAAVILLRTFRELRRKAAACPTI